MSVTGNPLDVEAFARLMQPLGPFEKTPHIALAVSGGSDSMALLLLLAHWCRAQGGRLSALTVDHGLRAESREEAVQVGHWASAVGAAHRILDWSGPKPRTGIQAAARRARYDLLTAWCRTAGVLHLVLAHQQDDQRETVAMRAARGDGPEGNGQGMAGMSAVVDRDGVRLLRPLLGVPRATLAAFLAARGQPWLDDPSNELTQFERIRWRRGLLGALPEPAAIRRAGELRRAAEMAVADLLSRSVRIDPAGFALVDPAFWHAAPAPVAQAALAQMLIMLGGGDYPPNRAALGRTLDRALSDGQFGTLGGCLIGRWRRQVLICREPAAMGEKLRILEPGSYSWDRRFAVTVSGPKPVGTLEVDGLGENGLAEMTGIPDSRLKLQDIPSMARTALPALRDAAGRLVLCPATGYDPIGLGRVVTFRLAPHKSATSGGFTVA
ncbi:MAG: tRNA lysidine(34) synthetase TilS [Rhodospirillaceae bacterium]|nr:tRNA lysidine(34) synthetase TilS [Rhodospirillaceae bacterium]